MAFGKRAKETQQSNIPGNESAKSHTVLAIALIATLAVLALFCSTFILLQLKFKEPMEITLSDWLKMILPIVGGAVVTIFAFLGVDRLKNFDERQDRLAKELRNDLSTQVDNAVKLVQPRINEIYQEWEKGLREKLADYDKAFSVVADRIDKYDRIIGSVEKLEEVSDAIGNVDEAHKFIAELFSNIPDSSTDKSQKTRILLALVERVKAGDIKGDSNDYHNLASELATLNYFEFAADVAGKGLDLFSDNIDLLSGFTYYSHKAGRTYDVEVGINRLETIERNIWNWRAFTFYIDVINDGEANEENRNKALQCVDDYKRVLPDEERAYMAEYETFRKYGELDSAENALISAEQKLAMTAQCSLTLSEIYHMRGDYDRAINSASRAILGQAETQPSSNTGAAFAHRGFSKDAKVHKAILDGVDIDSQYSLIHSAINDYTTALRFGYAFKNIKSRIAILQDLLPLEDQKESQDSDIEDRLSKLELAVAVLLKNLTSDNDD